MPSKVILIVAIAFSLLWPLLDMKYHGHFSDAEYERKVKYLINNRDYFDDDEQVKVRVNKRWVTLSGNIRAEDDKIQLGKDSLPRQIATPGHAAQGRHGAATSADGAKTPTVATARKVGRGATALWQHRLGRPGLRPTATPEPPKLNSACTVGGRRSRQHHRTRAGPQRPPQRSHRFPRLPSGRNHYAGFAESQSVESS